MKSTYSADSFKQVTMITSGVYLHIVKPLGADVFHVSVQHRRLHPLHLSQQLQVN